MDDPLAISNEMRQFDLKRRDFFDGLTPEQQKKFSPYLMIRWGSSVEGSRELQEFYVISANERMNRHFFSVNSTKHKKLQWLLATTVSPDMGTHRHTWIAPRKRESSRGTTTRLLRELFPNLRDDEIDVLVMINDSKQIRQYQRDRGLDED
jgi:hypothetical protein